MKTTRSVSSSTSIDFNSFLSHNPYFNGICFSTQQQYYSETHTKQSHNPYFNGICFSTKCGFENIELYDDETRLLLYHHTGKHRVWKAYNFRKFFINMCRRYAGTRPDTPTEEVFSGTELADFWVGHVARGSIKHYLQYNVDDVEVMKIHYLQVLPYLSVETEVNVMTSQDKKEFIEMKEKYDELLSES